MVRYKYGSTQDSGALRNHSEPTYGAAMVVGVELVVCAVGENETIALITMDNINRALTM